MSDRQPLIRDVALLWNSIPDDLLPPDHSRHSLATLLVNVGVFREAVRVLAGESETAELKTAILQNSGISNIGDVSGFVAIWLTQLEQSVVEGNRVGIGPKRHPHKSPGGKAHEDEQDLGLYADAQIGPGEISDPVQSQSCPIVCPAEDTDRGTSEIGRTTREMAFSSDAGLVLGSSDVGSLVARLNELGLGDDSLLGSVCSEPVDLRIGFEGAASLDEFMERNHLLSPLDLALSTPIVEGPVRDLDPSSIEMRALYPSGAVRSIPADVSIREGRVFAQIDDRMIFMDPEEEQSIEQLLAFQAKMTLFAVCVPF